jgi:hypothetical protein
MNEFDKPAHLKAVEDWADQAKSYPTNPMHAEKLLSIMSCLRKHQYNEPAVNRVTCWYCGECTHCVPK